ncbi:MAG: hypothetical protein U0L98_01105 [Clostridia bacterium]|nr:hypothetical protein [Clostridia bacterium]
MDFNPTAQQRARRVLEIRCALIDQENKIPLKPVEGKKAEFLAEYKRKNKGSSDSESELEGKSTFESAYELVNKGLSKKVFTPIICLNWLGINVKEKIESAYMQNHSSEEAYTIAREINNNICGGFEAISKEDVNSIINNLIKDNER